MRSALRFAKTTIIGGALFLAPLIVVIVLLREGWRAAASLLAPVSRMVPMPTVPGVAAVDALAILALIAVAFVAGLLARTAVGTRIAGQTERLVLRKMPGYSLLKGVASGTLGVDDPAGVQPCLARIEDAWCLAFVMERNPDASLTVFVPSAPTPTAGSVYFLDADRVRRLDVSVAEAIKCLMQLGVGSSRLLADRARSPTPGPVPVGVREPDQNPGGS